MKSIRGSNDYERRIQSIINYLHVIKLVQADYYPENIINYNDQYLITYTASNV